MISKARPTTRTGVLPAFASLALAALTAGTMFAAMAAIAFMYPRGIAQPRL
jgi:hypothetical protein